MSSADLASRVWAAKWLALALAIVAAAIAVIATYNVSVSPFRLHPRALRFGVAQTELLLDAGQSPLAVSTASLATAYQAADLAETADSNVVIDAMARAVHVAPSEIGVQQQYVQDIPRLEYYSQEAEVGTQILSSHRPYQLLVRNDQGTFVIQLFTQAPTGAKAIAIANAASAAMSNNVAALARADHVPAASQVILRRLAPATGGLVDPHGTRNAAILVGLVTWALMMIACLTLTRRRRRPGRGTAPVPAPANATEAAPATSGASS